MRRARTGLTQRRARNMAFRRIAMAWARIGELSERAAPTKVARSAAHPRPRFGLEAARAPQATLPFSADTVLALLDAPGMRYRADGFARSGRAVHWSNRVGVAGGGPSDLQHNKFRI